MNTEGAAAAAQSYPNIFGRRSCWEWFIVLPINIGIAILWQTATLAACGKLTELSEQRIRSLALYRFGSLILLLPAGT